MLTVGLLAASQPPGGFPGAGWLVLPGLAGFYVLATSARRAGLWAYGVGLVYVLAFSWSVRHVFFAGYIGIGLIGGLYYALAVAWMRSLRGWVGGPVAFGLAIAATHWLRAHAPEIPYPHGQPIHCLYRWPEVMGAVAWGGEPLGNALLATLAAAAVELFRSWRVATPSWRRAVTTAALAVVANVVFAVFRPPRAVGSPGASELRVLAIQPGFSPGWGGDLAERLQLATVLTRVTQKHAGVSVAEPPDLVLWPESTLLRTVDLRQGRRAMIGVNRGPRLAPGVRLVAGTIGVFDPDPTDPDGERSTPVGVCLDERGRLLFVHEKVHLAPAGEYVPFVTLLPESLRRAIGDAVRARFGSLPDLRHGRLRAPMETSGGVLFGVLLCYDNAFPDVARAHVAGGARVLCVLSNEAWYFGGSELDQMEAMTICRALETRTPVVRSTIDGLTLAVDAEGGCLARLPRNAAPPREPRVLSVNLAPGPGALPPLAWLQTFVAWLILASGLPVLWHVLRSWARLPRRRRGGDE